jgi:hypothetical protein
LGRRAGSGAERTYPRRATALTYGWRKAWTVLLRRAGVNVECGHLRSAATPAISAITHDLGVQRESCQTHADSGQTETNRWGPRSDWYWWEIIVERSSPAVNIEFLGVQSLYRP